MTTRHALTNALLLVFSIAVALVAAEVLFRTIDGYRLDRLTLAAVLGHGEQPAKASLPDARKRTFAKGFDVAWYTEDPPHYDRSPRFAPPADWDAAVKNYRKATGRQDYAEVELKFLYNDKWLEEACAGANSSETESLRLFKQYPGFVYSFASPDGSAKPEYRIVPRGWGSEITYYNNFGFRGPDIVPRKPDRVIRVAFLGASVAANGWPYAFPEYAIHFLRLWAKSQHLDVDFDLVDGARGGINSAASAKIMRYEVAPLRPDIVVYYEGGKDVDAKHVKELVQDVAGNALTNHAPAELRLSMVPEYLPLEQYSDVARRIYELLYRRGGAVAEPAKQAHRLTFDLKQTDPDLGAQDLPFSLTRQVADLMDMAGDAKSVGAQFVVASFIALAQDGLRLDPDRHRFILSALNVDLAPLTYAELRNAIDFENAVYRKLAKRESWPFLEMDGHFPQDPNYFLDMVHQWGTGAFRLQGWIMAQLLAPYVLEAVSNGSLPRPGQTPDPRSLAWVSAPPKRFDLACLPDH